MDSDHEELVTLFEEFLSDMKTNPNHAFDKFSQFKQKLQKHFHWEEKVLFPLFEERTGHPGLDTTFVLKNEHLQINTMFINKIHANLTTKNYSEITVLALGLNEILSMHRKMENDIFYPWFDDSLDDAARLRVLELLSFRTK